MLRNKFKIELGSIGIWSLWLYYWLLVNIVDIASLNTIYLFLLIQFPIILLTASNFKLLVRSSYPSFLISLGIYLLLVIVVNLCRSKVNLLLASAVDVIPLLIIFSTTSLKLPLKLVNRVFYLQIFISVVTFYAGTNIYGFLPGQAVIAGVEWRVSLFPYLTPPYTGVFALIIFLINMEYYDQKKGKDWKIITLTVYFLILASSRTVYLVFLFYIALKFLLRYRKLSEAKGLYFLLPFFFFISLTIFTVYGSFIKSYNNEFLDKVVFRNSQSSGYSSVKDLDRYVMWDRYLSIFSDNIVFGVGRVEEYLVSSDEVGTSETLMPLMLAQHGLVYVFFLIFILVLLKKAIKFDNNLGYILIVLYITCLLFYGTFLKGYNFMFLLIFMSCCASFGKRQNNYLGA